MLAVEGLDSFYGRAHILFGVTLEVLPGEVVALLGRNGAGKSTTFKSLVGLVTPTRGRIAFEGQPIAGLAPHHIARLGIGYVPEERRIFSDLTVAENLEVGRQKPRAGLEPWTPERLFDLFPNLSAMGNRPASRMSGGEQQMLAVARTLMGNPKLLLLDEPSEGLAPVIVDQMAETVRVLKRAGVAVLLSEQNLRFAGAVADRAYVLEKGRVRHSGTMDAAVAAFLAL